MPCYHPKPGYRYIVRPTPGQPIGTKEPCVRPCGYCVGCRLEYARQWAVRCTHEAMMHDENCFLTLTYNNENLPNDKSINKRDLQLFFKRLRKDISPNVIKYYAAGEYGDRLGRPHYHVCLFGYYPEDASPLRPGRFKYFKSRFSASNEHALYTSPSLEKIWGKGFISLGDLTFESAGYVARYCMKKINGKMAFDHYQGKTPEFALISQGIGKSWYEKYKTDIYPKDFTTLNGARMNAPRYYDYLLEKTDEQLFEEIKNARLKRADEKERRLLKKTIPELQNHIKHEQYIKERYKTLVTRSLQRSLHATNSDV